MKLYFASYSSRKKIREFKEINNLLESYLFFKNKKESYFEYHKKVGLLNRNMFLDSGAFSAFSRNEKIDIDSYINFIKNNKNYLTVYATLDVIGDYKATRKNTEYMESEGLHPLPVFHYGSPFSELKYLLDKYNYIALGGLVPYAKQPKKLKKWLDACFSIITKRDKICRIHGFGVNSFWAWERYPFYSVDATSWMMGGMYGRKIKFEKNRLVAFSKKDKGKKRMESFKIFRDKYDDSDISNALEFLKAAEYVTKLWKKRGISWKN